jgi:hypothetical protein
MARTVKVHLLDDLDGSVADQTVKFALDGTAFEIDLSTANAERLRGELGKYIAAGRRTGAVGIVTGRRVGRSPGVADKNQNRVIRQWARAAGIELNGRGRIPASVIERFAKEGAR